MSNARLQVFMVIGTMTAFILMLAVNELLFTRFEFAPGINWVYVPAGMRLLSTLLFGTAGAVGLLLVSWLACFFYFFPDDVVRSFVGGILATAAPYIAYRIAQRAYGLHASLANLSPSRLLMCVLGYSVASPLLHHIWFAIQGNTDNLLHSFVVMAVGDLTGTLIVIYTMKMLLSLVPAPNHESNQS